MPTTQHSLLTQALQSHGCTLVATLPSGWTKWTEGDLVASRPSLGTTNYFFLGTTGFRHGPNRTTSVDWPATKARLLAESVGLVGLVGLVGRRPTKPDTTTGFEI